MMGTRWQPGIRLVAILLLVASLSGCGFSGESKTIPPVVPTSTSSASPPQESLTPQPAPTGISVPTPTIQTPWPTLQLSDTPYHHANDLFELFPPLDWEIEEDDSSVSFHDPLGTGFIYLQVTNTGHALDETAFANFIAAREQNFFGKYESYMALGHQIDPEKRIGSVSKSLVFEGTPMSVVTFYDQKGQALYALDFWAEGDTAPRYSALYDDLFNQITVDSSLVTALEPYAWVYEFRAPDGLYTLNAPTSWVYDFSQDTGVRVDRFTAPDGRASAQILVFSADRQVDAAGLASLALGLIKQHIAEDIQLTANDIEADGSLQLSWESPGSHRVGTTSADIRENKVILFSSLYAQEDHTIYKDLLEFISQSFQLP